jgi:hypothetical protein
MPPHVFLGEDAGLNILQARARVARVDVQVFLPVVRQVVEAVLEVFAAVVVSSVIIISVTRFARSRRSRAQFSHDNQPLSMLLFVLAVV